MDGMFRRSRLCESILGDYFQQHPAVKIGASLRRPAHYYMVQEARLRKMVHSFYFVSGCMRVGHKNCVCC